MCDAALAGLFPTMVLMIFPWHGEIVSHVSSARHFSQAHVRGHDTRSQKTPGNAFPDHVSVGR